MTGNNDIASAVTGAQIVRPVFGSDDEDGQPRNAALARKELNDIGNADRFAARHGSDVIFVDNEGWRVWDGRRWSPDGAAEDVRRRAHLTARSILEEVQALQKRGPDKDSGESPAMISAMAESLFGWSFRSGDRSRIAAMLSEAQVYITVKPEHLDADVREINLENGTLRIEGSVEDLRAHNRDDMIGKMMPVAYESGASCPKFMEFLTRVQPDPEIRAFLQVYSGYCLTGDVSEQVLLFHYGSGANGKSTFVNIKSRIHGAYASTLPFSALVRDDRKRGGDATPELARLPGVRHVSVAEPEERARLAEAVIKQWTGGTKIMARHLHHDFFEFYPQFKLELDGNYKPVIRGQDTGIWRRMILVPWEVSIPKPERDKGLEDTLWQERSGILNWMLDGARIWLEDGLRIPAVINKATEEYRAESDPLGQFIADCLVYDVGERVTGADMYAAYEAWCDANSERPWSKTNFGRTMPERVLESGEAIHKVRGRIVQYKDVRLENVPEKNRSGRNDDRNA